MKLIIASTFIIDQAAKHLANKHVKEGESRRLLGKLHLTNAKNHGMAFGALSGRKKLLMVISGFAMAGVIRDYIRAKGGERVGLAFMLGAGASNIFDRTTEKGVTDYLYFEAKKPPLIFNLADIFVLVGVIINIISRIKEKVG